MIAQLLLASLLSFGGSISSTGQRSASVQLRISLTIIPVQQASMEMEQVDTRVAGIYKLKTNYLITGVAYAGTTKRDFLIIDDLGVLPKGEMLVAFQEGGAQLDRVPDLVVAMEWPTNMSERQVVAAVKRMRRHDISFEVAAKRVMKKKRG